MAISTIAEEKAKYKSMLVSWLTGFIIVFFIHYFMVFVIEINAILVNLMVEAGGETSLYDSIRAAAYTIKASIGIPATVMYLVLIILLVKFIFVYTKRLLVIFLLIIIAPFVGASYAIEKSKAGASKTLVNWSKEFTFNVFIQSLHAMLYVVFFSIAFSVSGSNIFGAILAIFLVNFMLKAEPILKNIFGLKSKQSKDLMKTKASALLATKKATAASKAILRGTGKIYSPVLKPVGKKLNKITNKIKPIKAVKDIAKDKDIRKVAKMATNTVAGAFSKVAAVPMAIIEPGTGWQMYENGSGLSQAGLFGKDSEESEENNNIVYNPQKDKKNKRYLKKQPKKKGFIKRAFSATMRTGDTLIGSPVNRAYQKMKMIKTMGIDFKTKEKRKNEIKHRLNQEVQTEEQLIEAIDNARQRDDIDLFALTDAVSEYDKNITQTLVINAVLSINCTQLRPLYLKVKKVSNSETSISVIKNVDLLLRKRIASRTGVNAKDVTQQAIDYEFSTLSKNAQINLVEVAEENVTKQGLGFEYSKLKDIAIELNNNKSKIKDKQIEFKEDKFEELLEEEVIKIAMIKTGKSKEQITNDEKETIVASMTEKELNNMILKVSKNPETRKNEKLEQVFAKVGSNEDAKEILSNVTECYKKLKNAENDVSEKGYDNYTAAHVINVTLENL